MLRPKQGQEKDLELTSDMAVRIATRVWATRQRDRMTLRAWRQEEELRQRQQELEEQEQARIRQNQDRERRRQRRQSRAEDRGAGEERRRIVTQQLRRVDKDRQIATAERQTIEQVQ